MNDIRDYDSVSTIVVTVLAIIIILLMASLIYRYSATPYPVVDSGDFVSSVSVPKKKPAVSPTIVIPFEAQNIGTGNSKIGRCFSGSIAYPFRQDAWRCLAENKIYDPCFQTSEKNTVFCQMNPLKTESFLIKLTQPLPAPDAPSITQDNWSWFLVLKDETYCSPFTGLKPFLGRDKIANYGCKSFHNPDEYVVLLGDLVKGNVWKAQKAVLAKNGSIWEIQSEEQVEVMAVWQ